MLVCALVSGCGDGTVVYEPSALTDVDAGARTGDEARSIAPVRGGGGLGVSDERRDCDQRCADAKAECDERNESNGPDDLMEPCGGRYQRCLWGCQATLPY